MLERQGIKLDRSTFVNWVGRACWWLTPFEELMLCTVLASPTVFAADTTLQVLDLGRGRTETGQLWCYAVDDSPWNGPSQPMAAYVHSVDRMNERLAAHISSIRRVLQVDGYNGFEALAGSRPHASVTLTFYGSHMLRRFEAEICGRPSELRRSSRHERNRPFVEALLGWLHDQISRLSTAYDSIAWLTDVLEHVISDQTKSHETHTLLPWNWPAANTSREAEQNAA
jgi:transposase